MPWCRGLAPRPPGSNDNRNTSNDSPVQPVLALAKLKLRAQRHSDPAVTFVLVTHGPSCHSSRPPRILTHPTSHYTPPPLPSTHRKHVGRGLRLACRCGTVRARTFWASCGATCPSHRPSVARKSPAPAGSPHQDTGTRAGSERLPTLAPGALLGGRRQLGSARSSGRDGVAAHWCGWPPQAHQGPQRVRPALAWLADLLAGAGG